jgi:hypothetical protein
MTVAPGTVVPPDREQQWESPARDPEQAPGVSDVEIFRQSCLSAMPTGLDEPGVRTNFCLFLLGAADRCWYRLRLDDTRFQAYAEQLLYGFGLRPQTAATMVSALPQLMESESARAAILEGAEVFDAWRETQDPNVILRLLELVPAWKRDEPGA